MPQGPPDLCGQCPQDAAASCPPKPGLRVAPIEQECPPKLPGCTVVPTLTTGIPARFWARHPQTPSSANRRELPPTHRADADHQVTVWIVIIKGRYAGMNKIEDIRHAAYPHLPQLHQSTFTEIGNEHISVCLNQLGKLLGLVYLKSNANRSSTLPTARRSGRLPVGHRNHLCAKVSHDHGWQTGQGTEPTSQR
ncbi:MAG: hypothetical protein CM15mP120_30640 [Pseudomonadota bacterium]|nr:MAG: hypothetical protein CM15mP120_30640 [Pseudomonadota bacterium]